MMIMAVMTTTTMKAIVEGEKTADLLTLTCGELALGATRLSGQMIQQSYDVTEQAGVAEGLIRAADGQQTDGPDDLLFIVSQCSADSCSPVNGADSLVGRPSVQHRSCFIFIYNFSLSCISCKTSGGNSLCKNLQWC